MTDPIEDVARIIPAADASLPSEGITSRTIFKSPFVRIVFFGFSEGEELSEHSAPARVIIQILNGRCVFCWLGATESRCRRYCLHATKRATLSEGIGGFFDAADHAYRSDDGGHVSATNHLPGQHLDSARMPGHWLLSRLGKRVLRPGGLELTRQMLEALNILAEDDVIEFGPGLGMTARIALGRKPRSYAGIERDETAARIVRSYLMGPHQSCFVASAEETGLTTGQASVIYGEAMLTMQGPRQKASMIKEAARLLRPGGRYGIHELCLVPDALPQQTRDLIEGDLSPNFGGKKYLERSEPENQKHEVPT